MREAERFEDMSQRGRLRVIQQDDGDMLVCVIEDMNSQGPCAGLTAGVEFCTSGGKSPKTLAALRALMQAMAEDNADRPNCHRRGKRGLGVDAPAPQQPAQAVPLSDEQAWAAWEKVASVNKTGLRFAGDFSNEVIAEFCRINGIGVKLAGGGEGV